MWVCIASLFLSLNRVRKDYASLWGRDWWTTIHYDIKEDEDYFKTSQRGREPLETSINTLYILRWLVYFWRAVLFDGSGAEYIRKEIPLHVLPTSSLLSLESPLSSFTNLQRVLHEEEKTAYNQAMEQNMR